MREVISVRVGQAGVQISNACCELLPQFLSLFLCCHRRSVRSTRRSVVLATGPVMSTEILMVLLELYTAEHGFGVRLQLYIM